MLKPTHNALPLSIYELVDMEAAHQPVLYQEIIHALHPGSSGRYVDGTLGAGGHASGILAASGPGGLLLGLDVDPWALDLAHHALAPFGERAFIKSSSFLRLDEMISSLGWEKVDGILLDLGASSMQFDTPGRGFSFLLDGPLDMRFDPSLPLTAAEIVNTWPEQELADLIYRYGEENASRRIARAIVNARPVSRTHDLAAIIEKVKPRKGFHHPATQTFQALRIAVNAELEAIEKTLPIAISSLNKEACWQSSPFIHWKTGLSRNSSAGKAGIAYAHRNNPSAHAITRPRSKKSPDDQLSRRWKRSPETLVLAVQS